MIRRTIATLSVLPFIALPAFAEPAEAEPKHPVQPLLWKVEGMDLDKPSWLFGTIHLGDGPVGTLHPAARKALEASDAVYTEVSMDPATQLGLARHFIRADGKKLSESIGEELHDQFARELKAVNPALVPEVFESFKTWAAAVTVPLLEAQLSGATPLDGIVWNEAKKAGKTTGALEKAADQFGIFDGLTEEEQIILLSESLRLQREARADGENPVDKLVEAYVSGDPKRVEAEVERQFLEMIKGEHKALGEKLLKQLLDDRDTKMAGTMAARLEAEPGKSHFFAVGAAHYVGKDNIGEQLRKKGYTVTFANP
ncbi:TraB/GumN family protein [Haloferula sp. A504]|uniref:TraB/GumN family protein n=1 Tax=Haloferula sp. A504 TaxID=3373601 RepID=UPI0031BF168A|nr:TraB/GumN family protein [Verrucomicrobiaceae bacterium E54]